ncbi:MAG: PEP-CTERM sorting domain-containing protein [Pseudomonadota bacterium]|nr:PEP-CTERM sorting domain-containing protein [Pseudomonadota bacterium]
MRFALAILIAAPAFAAPHSGHPTPRTGPEPSDIALFVLACIGVWLVRRAMRARFAKRPKD